jgi:general secretion pathway protein G
MNGRRGFTLVELLVVIVIIAVLSAIAIPKFRDKRLTSQESAARADLKMIRSAAQRFFVDTGLFPNAQADLTTKTKPTDGIYWNGSSWVTSPVPNSWSGPYLNKFPQCPIPDFDYEAVRVASQMDIKIKPADDGSNPYRFW